MAPAGLIRREELPAGWGLLECSRSEIKLIAKAARRDQRTTVGMMKEMNLLLASLRRVEVRIELPDDHRFSKVEKPHGGIQPGAYFPRA